MSYLSIATFIQIQYFFANVGGNALRLSEGEQ